VALTRRELPQGRAFLLMAAFRLHEGLRFLLLALLLAVLIRRVAAAEGAKHRVVIIGSGNFGSTIARLLAR
jgi:hypothetical protein